MPEKVHPIETSKQQPMIPQLEQVPEPSKLTTGAMQVRLIRAIRLPENCSAVVPVQVLLPCLLSTMAHCPTI